MFIAPRILYINLVTPPILFPFTMMSVAVVRESIEFQGGFDRKSRCTIMARIQLNLTLKSIQRAIELILIRLPSK